MKKISPKLRRASPGADVMNFKIFSLKNGKNFGVFDSKQKKYYLHFSQKLGQNM
jgi:hypothetical protein